MRRDDLPASTVASRSECSGPEVQGANAGGNIAYIRREPRRRGTHVAADSWR